MCNLIEMVAPERRGHGYTVKHLHCPFPDLPPMVGFAKTVTFRAKDKVPLGEAGYMQKRLDYLDYVAGAPQPAVMIMHDLDGEHVGLRGLLGRGAVERAQGARRARRRHRRLDPRHPDDRAGLPDAGGGDRALARYVHVADYGIDVNVAGMAVSSGDLIHADRHGAVVVPVDKIDAMQAAADKLAATEARIITAAKSGGGVAAIKAAIKG